VAHHVIPLRRGGWSLSGHSRHRSNAPINLDLWYARRSICPTGKIAHAGHAKIARRVTVSQAVAVAPSGKSGPPIPPSRAHKGRFAIVTKRDAGCDGRGGFKRRMKL
jgi:hypothetical protein